MQKLLRKMAEKHCSEHAAVQILLWKNRFDYGVNYTAAAVHCLTDNCRLTFAKNSTLHSLISYSFRFDNYGITALLF